MKKIFFFPGFYISMSKGFNITILHLPTPNQKVLHKLLNYYQVTTPNSKNQSVFPTDTLHCHIDKKINESLL